MRALAARDLSYLGLIGSRAKVRAHLRRAARPKACRRSASTRVHAPIGLDIGAVTPAEIAISILAELIAVRRGVDTVGARHEAASTLSATAELPTLADRSCRRC